MSLLVKLYFFIAVIGALAPTGCQSFPKNAKGEPAKTVGEIIIDNANKENQFSTTGDWRRASNSGDYAFGHLWCPPNKKRLKKLEFTAVWTPNIEESGNYSVYVWSGSDSAGNHAKDAPFTVYYKGGKKMIRVDLTHNVSQWNFLGTFRFGKGRKGKIVLSNDANGMLVADAVKFEYVLKK